MSDLDLRASHYVLGLLDAAEAAALEARLATDPELVAAVAAWRDRLGELDATAMPIQPSPALWDRVEASLAAGPQRQAMPGRPDPLTRAAVVSRPLPPPANDRAPFWRRMTGLAVAACLLLAAGLGVQSWRVERTPTMVAVLLAGSDRPVAVVNTFRDGRVELVPLEALQVPKGRALQVWTLWDRQVGPRSVAVLDRPETARLRLDDLPLGQDQLFEITLEPAGGSPTGRPTGPVLGIGRTKGAL